MGAVIHDIKHRFLDAMEGADQDGTSASLGD
jgi:hypothetical protein